MHPRAPLRVLIASHLYPSESRHTSAPWLVEQVEALAARDIDLTVLCCSPYENNRNARVAIGDRTIPVRYRSTATGPLTGTQLGLVASSARYRRHLMTYLRDAHPFDLLHAHFAFPDGFAATRVGKRMRLPVVVTLHGSDVTNVLASESSLAGPVRSAIASAQAIICVSAELERTVRAVLPPEVYTTVIPNGFNQQLFTIGTERRDLGYVFVGALRPAKNVGMLLSAYLENPVLHDWPLTIVGSGPLKEALEMQVSSSPSTANVRFVGELSREGVADAMRRAGALVLPSMREGYGVVAAEALACGTPVVASHVGGLPEMLADPRAGILIGPGDAEQLAQALRAVQEWPYSSAEVAGASGARPWTERAAQIGDLYAEVIARRKRGGEPHA